MDDLKKKFYAHLDRYKGTNGFDKARRYGKGVWAYDVGCKVMDGWYEEWERKQASQAYFDKVEKYCDENDLNFNSAHDRWVAGGLMKWEED